MTLGQRHFPSPTAAKSAAQNQKVPAFVVLKNARRPEFAWVALGVFMPRAQAAMEAGIQVMEVVQ